MAWMSSKAATLVLATTLVAACGGDKSGAPSGSGEGDGGVPPARATRAADSSAAAGGSVRPIARPSVTVATGSAATPELTLKEFPTPRGAGPHDVAPAPDGTVWWTAQRSGHLGRLDPATGAHKMIALGPGSSPHGVIVGPDGAAWVTDGGLNAIVRVDAFTEKVKVFRLPSDRSRTNLNTAAFDAAGMLWFTGQSGIYGRLNVADGEIKVFDAPKGVGPYGITATPDGVIYFVSLAGSYLARINSETGEAQVLNPPTPRQGARRVWSDSKGRLWVSEWFTGQAAMFDPATERWMEWKLPGDQPQTYAVYVDDQDIVWFTDFGGNSIVRFDPASESFLTVPLVDNNSAVRQLLGRSGEVWGAASGADKLLLVVTR